MNKLLNAGFKRLWTDKAFLLCLVFMIAGSILFSWMTYNASLLYADHTSEDPIYVEAVLFNLFPMIGAVCAIFISLFIGAEFDQGTIRNKLVVGHTRSQVFFSNLMICTAASVLFLLGMLLASGIFGFIFFKEFLMSWTELGFLILCSLFITAAFSAIYVSTAMAIPNRSFSTVAAIVIFFALLMGASYLHGILAEQEMVYSFVEITSDGAQFGDLVENPAYISGTQRSIFEFLYDLLPTGQASSLNNLDLDRCIRWPWLSLLVFTASTLAGWTAFKKKDIK